MTTRLGTIAHARSGDKGSHANVAVIARTPSAYPVLRNQLTAELVQEHFKSLGVKRVIRYEVPNLGALNFVLHGVLDGGGSRSLRIDAQGKSLGQSLLDLGLDIPQALSVHEETQMTDIPELTEEDFERAIPRHQRARLIRGDFQSGEDIIALTRFVGLTQEAFAKALGISVHTLRKWGQGRCFPGGPALVLLRIAARDPRIIRENLADVA